LREVDRWLLAAYGEIHTEVGNIGKRLTLWHQILCQFFSYVGESQQVKWESAIVLALPQNHLSLLGMISTVYPEDPIDAFFPSVLIRNQKYAGRQRGPTVSVQKLEGNIFIPRF
jgi:hypothetical protein